MKQQIGILDPPKKNAKEFIDARLGNEYQSLK